MLCKLEKCNIYICINIIFMASTHPELLWYYTKNLSSNSTLLLH